jgi:MoaA/NifB/PqqE/SkfB family radical SAM enzyme
MYLNTNYQRSGAGALLNYIEKGRGLRNSAGREVTERERESFIEKSERHRFERELRISPDPEADVSRADLERETERYIREFTQDRPSVRGVYSFHNDNGIAHTHVALTGERRDLYLDREDLERDRERLSRRLERDREREREPERDRELARDIERKREQERERKRERGRDLGIGR